MKNNENKCICLLFQIHFITFSIPKHKKFLKLHKMLLNFFFSDSKQN